MSNIALEDRIKYVGASEVADLFGVGFKSRWQLWLEKAGRLEPEDLSANEHIRRGNFLEPAIAEWAADKWGMKIRKVKRYKQHPDVPRLGASLDYESQEGKLIPVEIKSSEARQLWEVDGDTILDAPLKYLLQVQTQLACAGAEYAWLIVMLAGKLYRMKVHRHDDTIQKILAEVKDFWATVDEKKEPKPDFAADSALIASLMQVDKEKVVDLTGNNHLPVLCAEYLESGETEKKAKEKREAAMAEIRGIIGDAGKAMAKGFKITTTMVAESQISYVRKAYPNTRITKEKEKENV